MHGCIPVVFTVKNMFNDETELLNKILCFLC